MGIHSGRITGPIVHRQNFEKKHGMTPEQMLANMAPPCKGCGKPGTNAIRTLVQEADVMRLNPRVVQLLISARVASGGPPALPTIDTTYGKMIKTTEIHVCNRCLPEAERAAAKHPDWVLVEISRGPKLGRVLGQVPAALRARPTNAKG